MELHDIDQVRAAILEAEAEGACLLIEDAEVRALIRRRRRCDDIVSPARRLYASAPAGAVLADDERHLAMMRAYAREDPGLVFCAQSAATVFGVDAPAHLLREVCVLAPQGGKAGRRGALRRFAHRACNVVEVRGFQVVEPCEMLFDILRSWDPCEAVAAGDAALRSGLVDHRELIEHVEVSGRGRHGVIQARRLVRWLSPAARSREVSMLRAHIRSLGFAEAELDATVEDPDIRDEDGAPVRFRHDMVWRCANGMQVALDVDDRLPTPPLENRSPAVTEALLDEAGAGNAAAGCDAMPATVGLSSYGEEPFSDEGSWCGCDGAGAYFEERPPEILFEPIATLHVAAADVEMICGACIDVLGPYLDELGVPMAGVPAMRADPGCSLWF